MALPSRRELIELLRAQQGSMDLEEDCPICGGPSEVMTSCRHAFCLRCLEVWLTDHNNCPLCRAELCERVGEGNEVDANHPETIEAQMAGPLFERLDLDFEIEYDDIDAIILNYILPAGYMNTEVDDKAIVRVNYDHLMPWAIAYVTLNKRDARDTQSSLEDVARNTWNVVACAVRSTVRAADGQELEAGELWDMLDRQIHQKARQRGIAELKYAEGLGGASRFQYDLRDSLDKIVYEARRHHLEQSTAPPEEDTLQFPAHVSPITFEFETDEAGVIRAVEALNGHRSGRLDLRGLDLPNLYINSRRLIPFMIAAVYVHKPLCQPPEGADVRRCKIGLCHTAWELAAWALRDCLEDLHGEMLSANELEQTLTWSLGSTPSCNYGSRYRGPSSFADDLTAMLHTFIFWVFKVNKLQPPESIKPGVSRYSERSISGDLKDDDAGASSYDAWSGADNRSRMYLEEGW